MKSFLTPKQFRVALTQVEGYASMRLDVTPDEVTRLVGCTPDTAKNLLETLVGGGHLVPRRDGFAARMGR